MTYTFYLFVQITHTTYMPTSTLLSQGFFKHVQPHIQLLGQFDAPNFVVFITCRAETLKCPGKSDCLGLFPSLRKSHT